MSDKTEKALRANLRDADENFVRMEDDNAALRAQVEELEEKLSEAAKGFPGLRDALAEEIEAEYSDRVTRAEAELAKLQKREDLLERTLDDKWRTRKYIVCREYQFVDMCALMWRLMDAYDELKAERDEARGRVEKLEWLSEVLDFCWLNDSEDVQPISDDATDELRATWQAALAECGEG